MAAWAGCGPNAIITNASNPVQSQARRQRRYRVVVMVRPGTARQPMMIVRIFNWAVLIFVRCRSNVCLVFCVSASARTTGRSTGERTSVTGDTREIRALWTRKVKEFGGLRMPKGALTPRAERSNACLLRQLQRKRAPLQEERKQEVS